MTDDYAALQNAINDAAKSKLPVYIPSSGGLMCLHSKPLVSISRAGFGLNIFSSSSVNFQGGGLKPTGYTGPDLLIHQATVPGFPRGAPLVGSRGASYLYNGNYSGTINIRQTKALDLNGLTSITMEGWLKLPSANGSAYLLSSSGGLSPNKSDILPYQFTDDAYIQVAGGIASCSLTINGTVHLLGVNISKAAKASFYACDWSSSTGVMDFFIDGSRVARAIGITGSLTQNVFDDVLIGCVTNGSTMLACSGTDAGTTIDSVRISNSNRYGDVSTIAVPTAKFTSDANTIALVNFDTDVPGFLKVYSGLNLPQMPSPYYVVYVGGLGNTIGLENFVITDVHDMMFEGGLYCSYCAFNSKFRNLLFYTDVAGLQLVGNSNQAFIEGVTLSKGGAQRRYGITMNTPNGNRLSNTTIDAADLPLVINAGSPFIRDLLISSEPGTHYGIVAYQSRPLIDGFYFDSEGNASPLFVANIVFTQNWGPVSVRHAELDSIAGPPSGGTGQGIIFDSGYGGSIHETYGGNGSPTNSLVYINGNGVGMLSHPLLYDNSGMVAPYISMRKPNAGMTLTSCGSGALSSNANDMNFEVAMFGTTSCRVNFGIAFRTTPMVQCIDETGPAPLQVTPEHGWVALTGFKFGDILRCHVPIDAGQ